MRGSEGMPMDELVQLTNTENIESAVEAVLAPQEKLKQLSVNVETLTNLTAIANNVAKKGADQVVAVFKLLFKK